jgi:hypothetical protein
MDHSVNAPDSIDGGAPVDRFGYSHCICKAPRTCVRCCGESVRSALDVFYDERHLANAGKRGAEIYVLHVELLRRFAYAHSMVAERRA